MTPLRGTRRIATDAIGLCRPPLHAGLTYSRRSTDISEVIRSDYEDMGYRVVEVRRATEVPPDDPRLVIRPHPWLVWFERIRPTPGIASDGDEIVAANKKPGLQVAMVDETVAT